LILAAGKAAILEARGGVERVAARDPFFLSALEPYDPGPAGPVVDRMVRAAGEAGVGPMAAVAGAIAAAGAEAMAGAGARFCVVENGGDIAYAADRSLRVGVHAGASPFSDRYAFVLPPTDGVRGCCTSSATVGPSVSFGVADAVTVFAPDPAVADAWATRLCNDLRPGNTAAFASLDASRVGGDCAVLGGEVLRWGTVPPVVRARIDPSLITGADSI
jgi:ApbE superfamily uncharacterized protein (UPF0280 family)